MDAVGPTKHEGCPDTLNTMLKRYDILSPQLGVLENRRLTFIFVLFAHETGKVYFQCKLMGTYTLYVNI